MGKILSVYLFAFLFFAGAPAADASPACLDAAVVAELRAKFILPPSTENIDLCQPSSRGYKILEALSLIRTLNFENTNLVNPFNAGNLPTEFWSFFTSRVQKIEEMSTERSCINVVAFTIGAMKDGILYACPLFFDADKSTFERVAVMLHEARHFDGFSHIRCEHGPGLGKNSCDESMEQGGPWSIYIEALAKMALVPSALNSAQRAAAKVVALKAADIYLNKTPTPPEESHGVYLLSEDGKEAFVFNGSELIPIRAIPDANLLSRYYSLAAFPKDGSDTYTVDTESSNSEVLPAFGSFATDYNLKPRGSRPHVVDILNFPSVQGIVTETTAQFGGIGPVDLPFHAKKVFLPEEMKSSAKNELYLLDQENHMHFAKVGAGGKAEFSDFPNSIEGFSQIIALNGQRLGLMAESGEVFIDTGTTGESWELYAPLAGRRFRTLTRPFVWAKALFTP